VDDPAPVDWWEDPVAGEDTTTVELPDGAAQDDTINWCAEGEGYDTGPCGPGEVDVCEYVDGERGPPAGAATG